MRIRLSEERRASIVSSFQRFFSSELEHDISEFQTGLLVDFCVRELGAPIYNQAIQDARGFLQDKLGDLEGEFYEPEGGA
jgi:uncharacterized protein (DUF2164 family)